MSEFCNNKESCFGSYIKIDHVKYISIMSAKLREDKNSTMGFSMLIISALFSVAGRRDRYHHGFCGKYQSAA